MPLESAASIKIALWLSAAFTWRPQVLLHPHVRAHLHGAPIPGPSRPGLSAPQLRKPQGSARGATAAAAAAAGGAGGGGVHLSRGLRSGPHGPRFGPRSGPSASEGSPEPFGLLLGLGTAGSSPPVSGTGRPLRAVLTARLRSRRGEVGAMASGRLSLTLSVPKRGEIQLPGPGALRGGAPFLAGCASTFIVSVCPEHPSLSKPRLPQHLRVSPALCPPPAELAGCGTAAAHTAPACSPGPLHRGLQPRLSQPSHLSRAPSKRD